MFQRTASKTENILQKLKANKTLWDDGIRAELFKYYTSSLILHLQQILWYEGKK